MTKKLNPEDLSNFSLRVKAILKAFDTRDSAINQAALVQARAHEARRPGVQGIGALVEQHQAERAMLGADVQLLTELANSLEPARRFLAWAEAYELKEAERAAAEHGVPDPRVAPIAGM